MMTHPTTASGTGYHDANAALKEYRRGQEEALANLTVATKMDCAAVRDLIVANSALTTQLTMVNQTVEIAQREIARLLVLAKPASGTPPHPPSHTPQQ